MGSGVSSPTVVGRTEELRVLEAARARAANGEPAIVLLGGEAGVGKTRLVSELAARCDTDGTRVLVGGCVPIGDGGLPYAPMVEALRGLVADLGIRGVRELVGPSWPELARLLPSLGETEATGSPGQAAQARLLEVLLSLLGRLSEQTPLVLVLEDLHWADRSTRDLLTFLVRNLRRERVLLVLTYRSDEPGQARLGPYLAALDRIGPVQRTELPRLDRAETVAQLVGILGAVPPTDLVDTLFARSEGNPFFTEELLAAMRSGSSELPTTVRDLLRSRVEALPEPAKQVLAAIAVAGRPLPHRLLAAVVSLDDPGLVEALRVTIAHQLVVVRPSQDDYEFRHALLREIIYADLLPGERAPLHATLAAAIAANPRRAGGTAATVAAELAHHWYAAGDLERALPAAVEAGLAAEHASGFAEAHLHYERALELWTQVPEAGELAPLDRVTLLERAAAAAHLVDADPRAVELLRDALAGMDPAIDPSRVGLLHERLGRYLWLTLDDAAVAVHQEAVRLLPAEPASAERARVLAGYAQTLGLLARFAEQRQAAEEALAVARLAGARREEGQALTFLGAALAEFGAVEEALAQLREARRIAEKQADVEEFALVCIMLARVAVDAGRLEEGLAAAVDGAEVTHRLGVPVWHDILQGIVGDVEFRLGRWEEADRHFSAVLERDRLTGTKGVHTRWERARLDIARGDFPAGRRWLQEAGQLAAKAGRAHFDAQFAGPLSIANAELALWEDRHNEAAEAVAEGLTALARVGNQAGLPVLFALGLAAAAGRAERATARRATAETEAARRSGDHLLTRLEAHTHGDTPARGPELAAVLLQCRAEHARLHGRADPAAWAEAAARWDALGQPYPAAGARWRQAEALLASKAPRSQIEQAVRNAYRTAAVLGAGPLRREIERLAQRGRLKLGELIEATIGIEPEPPSPAASLGLTQREAEVFLLLAQGRTNRQIGRELYITEGTAGVHVSRILAKLGVSSRGEAAAIAHRLGLA